MKTQLFLKFENKEILKSYKNKKEENVYIRFNRHILQLYMLQCKYYKGKIKLL